MEVNTNDPTDQEMIHGFENLVSFLDQKIEQMNEVSRTIELDSVLFESKIERNEY